MTGIFLLDMFETCGITYIRFSKLSRLKSAFMGLREAT